MMKSSRVRSSSSSLLTPSQRTFLAHTENTHHEEVQKSRATFLVTLGDKYLNPESSEEASYVRAFKEFITEKKERLGLDQATLSQIGSYLDYLLAQQINPDFDVLILSTLREGKVRRVFPLPQVIQCVCAATLDDEAYGASTKSPEQIAAAKIERANTLCRELMSLKKNPPCHTGIRNALMDTLQDVYPGAHFIGDLDTHLNVLAVKHVISSLKQLSAEVQFQILRQWSMSDLESFSSFPELKVFLERMKGEISPQLEAACKEQGLEMEGRSNAVNKIKEICDRLFSLEIPYEEIHPKAEIVRYLLNRALKNVEGKESESKALQKAMSHLGTPRMSCDQMSISVYWLGEIAALKERLNTQKVRDMLWGNEEVQKELDILLVNCQAYFEAFVEGGRIDQSEFEIRYKAIKATSDQLENSIRRIKDNVLLVDSFFKMMMISDLKGTDRAAMYFRLLAVKEKVVLSDKQIKQISAMHIKEESLKDGNIDPLLIERILVHALLVSPANWTTDFYSLFSEYLEFLGNKLNLEQGDHRRQSYDYYQTYLAEFKWLEALYLRKKASELDQRPAQGQVQAPVFPPFPEAPKGFLLPNVEGLQGAAICGPFRQKITLLNALNQLSREVKEIILSREIDFLGLSDSELLIRIINVLISHYKNDDIKRDQLFSSLPKIFFQEVIKEVPQLVALLKGIDPDGFKNVLRLLGKDFFQQKIQNAAQLVELFDQLEKEIYNLPVDFYEWLLPLLGQDHLIQKIETINQLIKILNSLRGYGKVTFLRFIGRKFLIQKIANFSQLCEVLTFYAFTVSFQGCFLNLLGKDFLIQKIDSLDNLLTILNNRDHELRKTCLTLLGKDFFIQKITTADQLIQVLKLPESPYYDFQSELVNLLGEDFLIATVKTVDQLVTVLQNIPDFLGVIRLWRSCPLKELLISIISQTGVKGLIKILKIASEPPTASTVKIDEFLRSELGQQLLQSAIKGTDDLITLLRFLDNFHAKEVVLNNLGKACLSEIIDKAAENEESLEKLYQVLKTLNVFYWVSFLGSNRSYNSFLRDDYYKKIGIDLIEKPHKAQLTPSILRLLQQRIIKEIGDLIAILKNIFCEKDRLLFLSHLNTSSMWGDWFLRKKWLLNVIKNGDQLIEVLKQLPEEDRLSFLRNELGESFLRQMITSKDLLNSISELLPKDDKQVKAMIEKLCITEDYLKQRTAPCEKREEALLRAAFDCSSGSVNAKGDSIDKLNATDSKGIAYGLQRLSPPLVTTYRLF